VYDLDEQQQHLFTQIYVSGLGQMVGFEHLVSTKDGKKKKIG
jgi:hypothetical protein